MKLMMAMKTIALCEYIHGHETHGCALSWFVFFLATIKVPFTFTEMLKLQLVQIILNILLNTCIYGQFIVNVLIMEIMQNHQLMDCSAANVVVGVCVCVCVWGGGFVGMRVCGGEFAGGALWMYI